VARPARRKGNGGTGAKGNGKIDGRATRRRELDDSLAHFMGEKSGFNRSF